MLLTDQERIKIKKEFENVVNYEDIYRDNKNHIKMPKWESMDLENTQKFKKFLDFGISEKNTKSTRTIKPKNDTNKRKGKKERLKKLKEERKNKREHKRNLKVKINKENDEFVEKLITDKRFEKLKSMKILLMNAKNFGDKDFYQKLLARL